MGGTVSVSTERLSYMRRNVDAKTNYEPQKWLFDFIQSIDSRRQKLHSRVRGFGLAWRTASVLRKQFTKKVTDHAGLCWGQVSRRT